MISKNFKILLVILLLALVLRIIHLHDKAPGTDEVYSINNSITILEKGLYAVYDFGNPLLFYVISGVILLLNSVLLLKLIMVLIGLLTIIVTYLLVSKLLDEKIALVSSFLLALNPMHVLLSQHIRVYILLMLIYLLSTLHLYKFIKNKSNKDIFILTFTYIVAIYLHYFSAIFILAHLIIISLHWKEKKLIKKYVIGLVILAIITTPLAFYFLSQYDYMINQGNLITIEKLSIKNIPYPIYKFSSMMDISSTIQKVLPLIVTAPLVFITFLLGSLKLYKTRKEESKFVFISLLAPIIILAIIGFIFPVYSFRYLTYLLPLYIIPISYASKYRKLGLFLLLIIVILWLLILFNYYSIVTVKGWPIDFAI